MRRRRPHLGSHYQPGAVARLGAAALAVLALGAAAGCGGGTEDSGSPPGARVVGHRPSPTGLVIVVNAPFSKPPYVAQSIANGVELGVQAEGGAGGFGVGDRNYRVKVVKLDNELSPRQALRNVRQAVDRHAIAVIDEGTGVDASWRVAREADLPLGIVYQGGLGLVDPELRPNVFRIAPTDRGVAFRLGGYLVPKRLRVALLYDDTGYGQQGKLALEKAFAMDEDAVAARIVV